MFCNLAGCCIGLDFDKFLCDKQKEDEKKVFFFFFFKKKVGGASPTKARQNFFFFWKGSSFFILQKELYSDDIKIFRAVLCFYLAACLLISFNSFYIL